jgi:hypothetical protein
MSAKSFAIKQAKEIDNKLIVVAICFLAVSFFASYTNLFIWTMLVQYNIDHGLPTHFASAGEYLESLPYWVAPAYNLLLFLMSMLIIWIFVNVIHWVAYPTWIEYQKEKYPLSY